MMPITNLLSCTDIIDEFQSLTPPQKHHAKTYITGLIAAKNKTITGIARQVLPAKSNRALNKFLTKYNWDKKQFNHERLEKLQKHGETRWSKNGYIIIDDTITEKTGDKIPGIGNHYDHTEGDTIQGQNIVYAFYTDHKTAYPLTFRLYKKQDEKNQDNQKHNTKYDLAKDIITELEEKINIPAKTYLIDSWFTHDSTLINHIESYNKDWIGSLRSHRQVTYNKKQMRVDTLAENIDKVKREIDNNIYHIWTKKLQVSKLGNVKLAITEKETENDGKDKDKENPVKYLVTNKIDAPTTHLIQSYSMRWRIETFFEDSKQELGFGDCEMQLNKGTKRHWHLLMAAYSLVRLAPNLSALGTLCIKPSSLKANLEHSLKEAVYNLLSWVQNNNHENVKNLMQKIDHLFIHSKTRNNVQS